MEDPMACNTAPVIAHCGEFTHNVSLTDVGDPDAYAKVINFQASQS